MPWCEYLIKSFAYHRQQGRDWEKTRYTVWHILASSMSIDGKKLPSLQKFVTGVGKAIKKASDAVKSAFLREYEEYQKKIEEQKSKL